jgi:hypothetical protein
VELQSFNVEVAELESFGRGCGRHGGPCKSEVTMNGLSQLAVRFCELSQAYSCNRQAGRASKSPNVQGMVRNNEPSDFGGVI